MNDSASPGSSQTPARCLHCEGLLTRGAPEGLCPKCLLQFGLHAPNAADPQQGPADRAIDSHTLFPFDFGGYQILRLLGRGGMGAVFEAQQRSTGRLLALKVLDQPFGIPEAKARFLREGTLAATVNHPNSVYVFGTEEIEGTPVITMELVRGGTLRDELRKGPMEPGRAVDAILQVIEGLRAAAQKGVLHRDIKPANCFCSADGTVKVGDYGLSISALASNQSQLTVSGVLLGTPAFASPEQLRGEDLDLRSDIYAVGATLYSLLSGHAPFEAENVVQSVALALDKPPTPLAQRVPNIPAELAQIVERCLSKQAKDRFPTYEALSEALEPFGSETAELAPIRSRLLAGFIDFSILCLFTLLVVAACSVISGKPFSSWLLLSSALAYFPICDDRFGGTLGKKLMGLRLISIGKPLPRYLRGFLRLLIFCLPGMLLGLSLWLLEVYPETEPLGLAHGIVYLILFGMLALPAGLLCEFVFLLLDRALHPEESRSGLFAYLARGLMDSILHPFRRGNLPWHDRLTGMRLVQVKSRRIGTLIPERSPSEEAAPSAPASATQIGPFQILRSLGERWHEGFDGTLKRRVWIRSYSAETPPLSEARKSIARTTRLRWVSGLRTDSEAWDAFEAPSAEGLPEHPTVHWKIARGWLLELVQEIRIASQEGTLPSLLHLELVRVHPNGHLTLLDEEIESAPDPNRPAPSTRGTQSLLLDLCQRCLDTRRLPRHAADFLERLSAQRFENLAVLEANLRSLTSKPAEITRGLKLASIAVGLAPVLLLSFQVASQRIAKTHEIATTHLQSFGPYAPLARALCASRIASLESLYGTNQHVKGDCGSGWPIGGRKGFYANIAHDDLKDYARGQFADFFSSKAWETDPRFASWSPKEKSALEKLARREPPSQERLASLSARLRESLTQPRFPVWFGLEDLLVQKFYGIWLLGLVPFVLVGSLINGACLLVFNRTVPDQLFRIELRNAQGKPARRGLSLLRWTLQKWHLAVLFSLGPILKSLGLVTVGIRFNLAVRLFGHSLAIPVDLAPLAPLEILAAVGLGFFLLDLAVALWKPERSLADWILGTRLVPK